MSNKTLNVLTKYEYTTLISERADDIAKGSPITIKDFNGITNPVEIAKLEMKAGKCPLKVVRNLPGGTQEVWNLKDLINLYI